jgi:hypothetical protein
VTDVDSNTLSTHNVEFTQVCLSLNTNLLGKDDLQSDRSPLNYLKDQLESSLQGLLLMLYMM